MTPRQVRRAAERKANKAERKSANGVAVSPQQATPSQIAESPLRSPEPAALSPAIAHIPEQPSDRSEPSSPIISPSQLAANRANAHLSTGPRTPEGKAKSCLNAVKTGLTGRTVLLPAE